MLIVCYQNLKVSAATCSKKLTMRNAEHFCRRLVDLKITSVDCRLSGFVEESDNDRRPLSKSSIKPLILLITMLMLMEMMLTSHRTENIRLHFSNPGGRWAGWGACAWQLWGYLWEGGVLGGDGVCHMGEMNTMWTLLLRERLLYFPLQVTVLFLTSLSSGVFKQHGEQMPENSRIVFFLYKSDNGFEKHTKQLQNY